MAVCRDIAYRLPDVSCRPMTSCIRASCGMVFAVAVAICLHNSVNPGGSRARNDRLRNGSAARLGPSRLAWWWPVGNCRKHLGHRQGIRRSQGASGHRPAAEAPGGAGERRPPLWRRAHGEGYREHSGEGEGHGGPRPSGIGDPVSYDKAVGAVRGLRRAFISSSEQESWTPKAMVDRPAVYICPKKFWPPRWPAPEGGGGGIIGPASGWSSSLRARLQVQSGASRLPWWAASSGGAALCEPRGRGGRGHRRPRAASSFRGRQGPPSKGRRVGIAGRDPGLRRPGDRDDRGARVQRRGTPSHAGPRAPPGPARRADPHGRDAEWANTAPVMRARDLMTGRRSPCRST